MQVFALIMTVGIGLFIWLVLVLWRNRNLDAIRHLAKSGFTPTKILTVYFQVMCQLGNVLDFSYPGVFGDMIDFFQVRKPLQICRAHCMRVDIFAFVGWLLRDIATLGCCQDLFQRAGAVGVLRHPRLLPPLGDEDFRASADAPALDQLQLRLRQAPAGPQKVPNHATQQGCARSR
eukprot:COSAG05_NODE_324_length_11401_cov_6.009379_6_plen_176_part_00